MLAKRAKAMRELVLAVGGDLRGDENRKAWLARVARAVGCSPRMIRSAWQNEIRDPEHKITFKLQRALEARARNEEAAAKDEYRELQDRLAKLECRLMEIDPSFRSQKADEVREAIRRRG